MDPGGKIYTIDEFRCWKVENLDDERSDENRNEGGGYRLPGHFAPEWQKVSRFAPLNRYHLIIDKVFFDNFFGNYLFISCIQKIIITTNLKPCRTNNTLGYI
jgi:hypothetical protein